MPWIETGEITPQTVFSKHDGLQVYCGLDSMVTLEVRQALKREFPQEPLIYDFSRAMQAPYLEMMQRGLLVDDLGRRHAAAALHTRTEHLYQMLNLMTTAVWDKPCNPRSPQQLKDFFFRAMALPEVWISQKGVRKVSTNREALEKLADAYMHPRPIIACILAIRDLAKQLEVMEKKIDSDGRFRTSYNIAGTETGRSSSSTNAFGTGGNAQNIPPYLRYVFVADQGWKLCQIDAEQVEARDVGFFCGCLFDDWTYLDSCESGDLHTNNSKLIWPELPWTGDRVKDRKIAERAFYREFSYRDFAKRGGHLSNYMGTAWTAARVLKVPLRVMEDFQLRYITGDQAAFPAIPRFWQWVVQELQQKSYLTNPFGRKRFFFGRDDDAATFREAIANLPQGTTADRVNLVMWRIWKYMPQVQLLANGYDSILFQYRESANEREIVEEALRHTKVELLSASGRRYTVPFEAKVGWNWGVRHKEDEPTGAKNKYNPDGLVKWTSAKQDLRRRATGLQRVVLQ